MRKLFLITILIWSLTACVDIVSTQESTATPEIQVTFFTPELTLTETLTNVPTETATLTETSLPTSTSSPTETPTETNTPEPTPTLTPVFMTPTPISTHFGPTPIVSTPFGQHSYPYKSKAEIYYVPRGNWLMRKCYVPVADQGCPTTGATVTAGVPVYVYCVYEKTVDEWWGSPDFPCWGDLSVRWFVLKLDGKIWSDPKIGE